MDFFDRARMNGGSRIGCNDGGLIGHVPFGLYTEMILPAIGRKFGISITVRCGDPMFRGASLRSQTCEAGLSHEQDGGHPTQRSIEKV